MKIISTHTIDTRGDVGIDVSSRRLAQWLYRYCHGDDWSSMDNIFIDSMQSFPELLLGETFYWTYSINGRTWNYTYYPHEDCFGITLRDRQIIIEEIKES